MSPTEPKLLRDIGTTSILPERYGADVLFVVKGVGKVGVQRKEQNDLIASVRDGRLGKELAQMKALGLAVLVVEGRQKWGTDGFLVSRTQWSLAQQMGTLLSTQANGVWYLTSQDLDDTIKCLGFLRTWLEKESHQLVRNRPNAESVWGKPGNRDWQRHLLQGFDGIGPGMADRIIDHFGKVPIGWTVTGDELMGVRGLGKGRVGKLLGALE